MSGFSSVATVEVGDIPSEVAFDAEVASDYQAIAEKDQPDGYPGLDENGALVGVLIARTGTKAEIDDIVLESGEVAATSDTNELRVGDGSTSGGANPSERTIIQARAVGTAYSLTNSTAALDFGTTDPVCTLTKAGTWRIRGRCVVKYAAATFAATQAVTIKLRRTNNTAADLDGGSTVVDTDVVTTKTFTLAVVDWEADLYQTSNANDAITIFAHVATAPGAGSLQITEALITAEHVAD